MTAYLITGERVLGRHSLLHSPVLLYQFDGTLNDSSGNGFNLAVESGTARYADVMPGLRGVQLRSTRLIYNTFQAALNILGDYTAEMLVTVTDLTATDRWFYDFGGLFSDDSEAANHAYSLRLSAGPQLATFTESGAGGTDVQFFTDNLPPQSQICHLAITRIAGVNQIYLNGAALGAPSGALSAPTGGTSGRFRIGAEGKLAPECVLASFKLIATGLTATQIKNEYNRTIGPIFGLRA